VAPGYNLWIPSFDQLNAGLAVAWIKMRGMAARRLELKTLLLRVATDLETSDALQRFGILIDCYLLEDTGASEGEDVEEDSEEDDEDETSEAEESEEVSDEDSEEDSEETPETGEESGEGEV
jgi:hypothetical protein